MSAALLNPFATCRTRPGAIEYLFPEGIGVDDLVERLKRNDWREEIIGPHGSGKTTLLMTLLPALKRRAGAVALHRLASDGRLHPARVLALLRGSRGARLVAIDGFEQLGGAARTLVRAWCRLRGKGLIVTGHRPMGLPGIYRTRVSRELAGRIVARLAGGRHSLIHPSDVDAALARHATNLREALFTLYDVFEDRSHT